MKKKKEKKKINPAWIEAGKKYITYFPGFDKDAYKCINVGPPPKKS